MEEEFNNDGVVRGFYYDHQIQNPLTRVALYPNAKMNEEFLTLLEKGDAFDPKKLAEIVDRANDINKSAELWSDITEDDNIDEDSKGQDHPYGKTPIAVSILSEDFQVDIANNWGESGGDPIGGLWNNVKGLSPYLAEIGRFLNTVGQKTEEYKKKELNLGAVNSESWSTKLFNGLESGAKLFGNFTKDKAARMTNRGLSVQGTQFSYFGGTGVNFGNMSMKFTLFPEFKDGKFISVINKIESLLPYCIGPFVPVDLRELDEKFESNFIKEFAHWQLPPGGFEPDIKNIDIVQKGTLKLVIGSYYALTNLVVSGCNLTFSKQLVKNPFMLPGEDRDFLSPMFCDVNLMLKPATKYSYNSLLKFIQGRPTEKLRDRLATSIGTSFKKAKEFYEKPDLGGTYYV